MDPGDALHYKIDAWLEKKHGVVCNPDDPEKWVLIANDKGGYDIGNWKVEGVERPNVEDFVMGRVNVAMEDMTTMENRYKTRREKLLKQRKESREYLLIKEMCRVLKMDIKQIEQAAWSI